jgi:hypothetical protein
MTIYSRVFHNPLFRVLFVSAAIMAALVGPTGVHAQSVPSPDPATAAAIATLRSNAIVLVKPVFQDIVAASYTGQVMSADPGWVAKAMIARAKAEQTAFAALDPASIRLIDAYNSAVQNALASPGKRVN